MDGSIKACDFCGEDIKAIAKKCKHCGEFLENLSHPNPYDGGAKEAKDKTMEMAGSLKGQAKKIVSDIENNQEVNGEPIKPYFLWAISLFPFVFMVIQSFVRDDIIFGFIFWMLLLMHWDMKATKKAGHEPPLWFTILCIPVYVFKRCKLGKVNMLPFYLSIPSYVIFILCL
jgi:hypothetical protein